MYIKIHRSQSSEVVAVCDEDLIGKTFEEKGLQLKITARFYKGKHITDEELLSLLKRSKNCNFVGKKTIEFAIKHKIINKDNIITIKKIPHATILLL